MSLYCCYCVQAVVLGTFFSELLNSVLGVDINHHQCPQSDTCLLRQLPPH